MTVKTEDIVFKLSADNKKLSQQLKQSRSDLRRYSTQAKQTSTEQHKLADLFSRGATQVAAFQGPLNGVSGRLSAVSTMLRTANPLALGFGTAVSVATVAIVKGTFALDAYEVNLKRTTALLKTTGYASGLTAKQLQEQARALALDTLTSTEEVQKAQAKLLTFNRVSGETFTKAISLSQDLAETGFGSLTGNAAMLGKALQDPVAGLSALTRVGVSFTEQQKEQIKTLAKSGEALEAQRLILDAVASQVEGAGKSVATDSIAGSSDTLGQNIEELTIAIAKMSGAKDAAIRFLNATATAAKNATDYIETSDQRRLQVLTKERREIKAQIAEYKGLTNLPTINPFGKSQNELFNLQVQFGLVDKEMRAITDKHHQEQLADAEEARKAREGAVNAELDIFFEAEEAKSRANIKANEKLEAQRKKAAADLAAKVDTAVLSAQDETEQLKTELQRRATIAADIDNKAVYEELYRYQDKQAKLTEQYQNDLKLAAGNLEAKKALQTAYDESEALLKQEHQANLTAIEAEQIAVREEQNRGFWDRYSESLQESMLSMDELAASTIDNFSQRMGGAFESMIFDSESLGDAFNNLAEGMARSIVNAIGQMAAQWLAYQAVQLLVGKTTATAGASAVALTAQATSLQAGLATFASTAAVPIVGPAAAPAAMAASLAITEPIAATIAALSAGSVVGMAHSGISEVPNEGTWLLDKGERVYTNDSANKLDQMHSAIMGNNSESGSKITINLVEDASRAGQVEQSKGVSGEEVITIVVSNIRQGGEIASAQEQTYNLQRAGY